MYNKLNMYNIYCIIEYVHTHIYIYTYIYIHTYETISFIVRDTLHIRPKIRWSPSGRQHLKANLTQQLQREFPSTLECPKNANANDMRMMCSAGGECSQCHIYIYDYTSIIIYTYELNIKGYCIYNRLYMKKLISTSSAYVYIIKVYQLKV